MFYFHLVCRPCLMSSPCFNSCFVLSLFFSSCLLCMSQLLLTLSFLTWSNFSCLICSFLIYHLVLVSSPLLASILTLSCLISSLLFSSSSLVFFSHLVCYLSVPSSSHINLFSPLISFKIIARERVISIDLIKAQITQNPLQSA